MAILHRTKAYLYDNLLAKDNPNDLMARVLSKRSLEVQQVCEAAHRQPERLPGEWRATTRPGRTSAGCSTASRKSFNGEKQHPVQFNQREMLRAEIPNMEVEILGVSNARDICRS